MLVYNVPLFVGGPTPSAASRVILFIHHSFIDLWFYYVGFKAIVQSVLDWPAFSLRLSSTWPCPSRPLHWLQNVPCHLTRSTASSCAVGHWLLARPQTEVYQCNCRSHLFIHRWKPQAELQTLCTSKRLYIDLLFGTSQPKFLPTQVGKLQVKKRLLLFVIMLQNYSKIVLILWKQAN